MSKTILLIRNAAQGDFGGAETYQISISSILINAGYSPIIVTRSKKLLESAHSANIPSMKGWWWSKQNWSGKNNLLLPLYLVWQLLLTGWYVQLVFRTKAQALHIQSRDDFIAGTIAGRVTGRKVVWTDHMDLRYVFENIDKPLRNPVGKLVHFCGSFANHVILISDNEYRLVTSHVSPSSKFRNRIHIIKNGVVDKLDSLKKPVPGNIVSFCLASRIVTNKGIGEAISAYVGLKKRIGSNKSVLNIYGSGDEIEHFKYIARKHKDIIFHGHQEDAIQKIYLNDVFILPSYQEGFSIALLEATMLGMPIIVSNVDSNGEIVQHGANGLLVKAMSPDELSGAMYLLFKDSKLRSRLGRNARKTYKTKYNLSTITSNQIIPLYK